MNLIFANKTEDDILLKENLSSNQKNLNSTFILSTPQNKKYEMIGYIDEHLLNLLPDSETNSNFVFICGRDSFCDVVEKLIQKKGYTEKSNYFIF